MSWLAVRGKHFASVLSELNLQPTGNYEEIPESPLTGMQLGDWFLVVANDFGFIERVDLGRLSGTAEVVTCALEEHVMISAAASYRDGNFTWSIRHESERGISHLDASGSLPSNYHAIRERQLKKQSDADGENSGVDYVIDVPLILAEESTGFRIEMYIGGDGNPMFERLQPFSH
jgi:hypothetical protein